MKNIVVLFSKRWSDEINVISFGLHVAKLAAFVFQQVLEKMEEWL